MRPQSPLWHFIVLYGALFVAFGVASPFLPGLLEQDGLKPGAIGVVLAAGTAVRLLAGPLGGVVADRTGRPVLLLAGCIAAAAVVALGYAPARGFAPLLLVSLAHAAVLAPVTPLADALALGSATGPGGFAYGWVRGAGSAAFVAGTLVAGQMVGWAGLGVIVWLNAGLLAAAAVCAARVPNRVAGRREGPRAAGSFADLLRIPAFARAMVVVALVGGSHALHDGFEVIRWREAGLSPAECSVLWSMSVLAEVAVFFVLGRPLLARLGPAGAMMLSAAAGMLRWATAARTAWFPAMALVEPLHGLTFALLHLSAMAIIARVVPARLAATAQAFYGTIAMGATSAAVTLAAGSLFARFGAGSFWAMAAMCLGGMLAAGLWLRPSVAHAHAEHEAEQAE